MAWSSIPNFGDPYAKINQRMHSSGAQVIEVLYGARDGQGRPVSPQGESDGHGHWIALEIDGCYQMLSWRHPAYEGGAQEYGRGRRDNALFDLEQDIAAKQSICTRAESILYSQDWRGTSGKFRQLLEEWKQIYNWGTPKEQQLWERFQQARQICFLRREDRRKQSKEEKQRIISQARNLENSTDWKTMGARMQELFVQWKQAGSAGKIEDETLWAEFNDIRQRFYERCARYFDAQKEHRDRNRQIKLALISQAAQAAQDTSDWKMAGDQLRKLMDQWKTAGSAGREEDNKLWSEFNAIRQDFFSRRKLFYQQRERIFLENAGRKSRIAQEASAIAAGCDYSTQNTERMKELDREWKTVGFSGKENEGSLWNVFRNAKDSFWSGKRAYSEQRQQEWRNRLCAAIARKREQISNLQNQIDELEYKISGMRNQEYISNMMGWIGEKKDKIRQLEIDIYDMERKLS